MRRARTGPRGSWIFSGTLPGLKLAKRLMPSYGVVGEIALMVRGEADRMLGEMLAWDIEPTSTYFTLGNELGQ